MERTEETLILDDAAMENCIRSLPFPADDVCFFDIETTGLSPAVSSVYLIGAACYRDGCFSLTQWFADDYTSEQTILASFAEFAAPFSVFAHYNGSTFDIPYLGKKYNAFKLPSPFQGKESLDFFREAKRKKDFFRAPDMKLTTMEQLLGFRRNDRFSGKDCIELYTEFMQKKFFRDKKSDTLKKSLLLHNHDDILGTILCSQLLKYCRYTPVSPVWKADEDFLVIRDTTVGFYPVEGQYEKDGVSFRFRRDEFTLSIPLYKETLCHYYKNYRDYFYLPAEDMAVHKSVGIYVDRERREKATASNCYTKKSGLFLPLPKNFSAEDISVFQEDRRSRSRYLLLCEDSGEPRLSHAALLKLLECFFLPFSPQVEDRRHKSADEPGTEQ